MYCNNCGNELKENEQFCSKCGAKIQKANVEIKNSYEKEYETSKKTLKMSLISMLLVAIISILLNTFSDFGAYVGKYLFIIAIAIAFVSLVCCYYFSVKGKITQPTWIQVVLGILIVAIIIFSISTYIEYSEEQKLKDNINYYRQNY